jgi:hypothetical protein
MRCSARSWAGNLALCLDEERTDSLSKAGFRDIVFEIPHH